MTQIRVRRGRYEVQVDGQANVAAFALGFIVALCSSRTKAISPA
jgi:hypothetical protein